MRNGSTLIEIVVVLALWGAIAGLAGPRIGAAVDRLRLRGAREELLSLLERTRAAAVSHGDAELEVRADSGTVSVYRDGVLFERADLEDRYRVSLRLSAGREASRVRYGRLGLGVFASRTVHLVRGADTLSVSISTFGRPRRW